MPCCGKWRVRPSYSAPHFQLCFVLCYRSATKTAAARHRPYTRRGGDWLPDRHGNGHYVGGGDPLYSHTLESVNQLAVFANALPPIVLGPLLLATMPRSEAPVVLSALVVTLTLFISLSTGLATTQAAHRDYFTVAGASRLTRMLRLEVPSAIPTFVDGLKMAAPAALLGAILAEWFGAERGIGPIFVAAMQNYQTELLWLRR
ncbi:hypothetical protein DMH27_05585 [Raoultella planticola]|nr:hypothetical protein [Raoultella planticola]